MQTQPARNICMLLKLERIPQPALCLEPPKSIWKKRGGESQHKVRERIKGKISNHPKNDKKKKEFAKQTYRPCSKRRYPPHSSPVNVPLLA